MYPSSTKRYGAFVTFDNHRYVCIIKMKINVSACHIQKIGSYYTWETIKCHKRSKMYQSIIVIALCSFQFCIYFVNHNALNPFFVVVVSIMALNFNHS